MSKRIRSLEKKKNETKRLIKTLEQQRNDLLTKLDELSNLYASGDIDSLHHQELRFQYLRGETLEDWQLNYNYRHASLNRELKTIELRTKSVRNQGRNNKLQIAMVVAFAVLFTSLVGLAVGGESHIGGAAVSSESVIPSNATIQVYFAVAASENITNGIEFGFLPPETSNNNATDNYNVDSTNSSLFLTISGDSNVNVDFCLAANTDLKNGTDSIPLANLRFANATTTDIDTPSLGQANSVTTSYQLNNLNVLPGSRQYYRFWLDIPSDTPALSYNNTITFGAVQTGSTCPG